MNVMQGILHSVEEGKARILTRIVPFFMILLLIVIGYNIRVFNGLDDPQSMDNAQLARQISRGDGFTTKFIRPYALSQLSTFLGTPTAAKGAALFPDKQFPKGTQRVLPDTYNSPGYPFLLAQWFKLTFTNFTETSKQIALSHSFSVDRRIPWLNQIFLLLTAISIFILGLRLFDQRVAWMAMTAFLLTNVVWQFSITALSTDCLMFLCTAAFIGAVEIYAVGEDRFQKIGVPLWPAWLWMLLLAVAVGLASLTRLQLLAFVIPFGVFLFVVPNGSKWMIPPFILIVLGMTGPWFWHMYQISGSPLGSNVPLLHYGTAGHEGNEIFCTLAAPNYDQLFKDASTKQFQGFGWNFSHGWDMLGVNPLVVLFFASILHGFKRGRAHAFRWLLMALVVCVVFVTNFAVPHPETLDTWNSLILLLPGMLVVGSAFFFILLDRLNLQLWILNNAVCVGILILTACPMVGVLLDSRGNKTYPPYVPAAIHSMGDFVRPEDWITTDMPWAIAWYGDHSAVWIPDSLSDFDDIYDNYNNSGLMLITPVLLSMPATSFTSGEYKDWMPFVSGAALPANFPLNTRAPTGAGFIEYMIWGHPAGG